MEYLIVFGIAFMMTLPLIIIYATQTGNVQADITNIQAYKAASKINDYAEQVYYMGPPTQRTLYIDFPAGINSVTIAGNMITLNVTTADRNYQVITESNANLSGSIANFEGEHVIVFQAQQGHVNISER
jgi:hypothetical protein